MVDTIQKFYKQIINTINDILSNSTSRMSHRDLEHFAKINQLKLIKIKNKKYK